jgi:pimeloyl-ACP methyl ester carboxylesterase
MALFRVVSCPVLLVFLSTVSLAQENKAVPRFEKAGCAIAVPANEKKAECGYLTVRENRTIKNSRTIRLPVVILKSDAEAPKPDPVLRMLGGPGASSLKLISGRNSSPWLKDRDMIILEQRGAQFSQPTLDCPEVKDAIIAAAKERLVRTEADKRELEAVKICRDRLMGSGVDLSGYNSAETAADIEDLRRSLKLDKVNLYGLSYSVRVMLEAARDYPTSVRSLVLESNLLPEINYDEVGVDGIVRVLDLLFSRCAADADCHKAFQELEKEFYAMVRTANLTPLAMSVKDPKSGETVQIQLTGNELAEWVIDYLLSNEPEAITYAPLLIYTVANGNLKVRPLQNYASDKLGAGYYSLGLRYSVWCGEETPFEHYAKIDRQETKYPGLKGYRVQSLPAICRVWNVPAADKLENKAVKSDLPALIMQSEYDAYTTPDWGKQAAKNLRNGHYVEFPWLGHGPAFYEPCIRQMVADFLNDPQATPKNDCAEEINKKYKFVTAMPKPAGK